MLAVIRLDAALWQATSAAWLTRCVAEHEVLLLCDRRASPSFFDAVRGALCRRSYVMLLLGEAVSHAEESVIGDLLQQGVVPVLAVARPGRIELPGHFGVGPEWTLPGPGAPRPARRCAVPL
jgi:hypothetical protein